jgi:steroid delta-isomerase-like uncharacterized protein
MLNQTKFTNKTGIKVFLIAVLAMVLIPNLYSQDRDKLIKKIYSAYSDISSHNTDNFRDYVTEDFTEHSPNPGQGPGAQGLIDAFKLMFKAYPDLKFEIKDIVVSDDLSKASVLFRLTGTNTGDMMGMPATNKAVDVMGIDWLVFKGDKATEHWGYADTETMMKQLGLMK